MKKSILLLCMTLFAGFMAHAQTTLTLYAPSGGTVYYGQPTSIVWTYTGTIANVKLKYSTDYGATFNNIATVSAGSGGAGFYSWNVPTLAGSYSGSCMVRVESAINSSIFSVSPVNFSMAPAPSITITAPNGGESWTGGSSQYIYWTSVNVASNYLNLYYSTDAGANYTYITSTYASNGYYYWSVPTGINSSDCIIKIYDYSDTNTIDISNATFSITSPVPQISVVSPNGGETWVGNSYQYITWSQSNLSSSGLVNLYYSTDGGATWNYITNAYASNLSYYWTVPNTINSAQCRVKVEDYGNTSSYDISNANFTITPVVPLITVTTPNGGENWAGNSSQYIYFSYLNPSSAYVNLHYSTDGGANWTLINYTTASSGYYYWTIPTGINSTTCKIMVSDYYTSSILDVSDANFTITSPTPQLTLTSPNGGESWAGNSYQYITWTQSNLSSSGLLNLYYSTDGGATWNFINNAYSSNLSYYWTVPNTISSTQCRVKVEDYGNANTYDISDVNFTISPVVPAITVTTPNGGENWTANAYNYIYFTAANTISGYVNLYYSNNNGTTWTYISNTTASNGYYYWYTPNISSSNCLIKIEDYSNASYYDVSNAVFTIAGPPITVTAPNGYESLCAGNTYSITWSASAQVSTVNIQFSSDYGSTFTTIASNVSASLGTYSYTIPSVVSSNGCYIKIVNTANSTVYDMSDNYFYITAPSITTSNPYSGQVFTAGTSQYIYWSVSACLNTSTVDLYYSTNGGTSWTSIATNQTASTGYYYWLVPNVSSTNCKIKVVDHNNSSLLGTTTGTFTISVPTPTLTLTTPTTGSSWNTNTGYYIYWSSTYVTSVNLFYSTNGGTSYTSIASGVTASNGYYYFTTPSTAASNFCVKIVDASNASLSSTACNITLVAPTPSITSVNNPYAAQVVSNGSSMYISWTSANVANVKVEFSNNGGTTYQTIVTSTPAASAYAYWTVSSTASTNCKIRVSDVTNSNLNAVSGSFTVTVPTPTITSVSYPYAGQQFTVGTSSYIQWSSSNVANVKIELSTDGGATYPTSQVISSSYSATNQYYSPWTVPNNVSNTCKVRVSDASNSTVFAVSPTFSIVACTPTLSISNPYSGQQLTGGSYTYIYWSASCVTNISIEYSANNGTSWTTVAASTSATTGSYYWAVPTTATTQGKIRIKDLASGSTTQATSGTFTIGTPTVTVTSPNGSENWTGGTSHNITWNSTYNTSNYVNLEYSIDSGASWSYINYAYYTGNSGSYNWTVPNTPSTQCKVRVSDYYNSSITDVSNSTFTITQATPQIVLSTPNGGETWATGYAYNITWSSVSVNNVKIEYSTNGGTTWSTIVANYPASYNSYSWTVPNTPSTNCKVRVSDATSAAVNDVSSFAFTIATPSITVGTPNGGEVWQGLTSHYIYWSNTNLGVSTYVNIEYSTDGGVSWNYIVYGTYNNGYYNWSVPNTVSANCLIRVSDYYNANVNDISNALFSISAASTSLAIYAPNGGEIFGVGSTQTISWYSQNITNVKLEFSSDGGTTYSTIIASTPNNGYYYWTVPNTVSNTCKIKVSNAAVGTTNSTSASNFSIVNPTVQVTSPNGFQNWTGLTTQNITWTSTAASNYVTLQYTTDNQTWYTIGTVYNTGTVGTYSWSVPNVATTTAKVKVIDYYNNAISDVSDTTFTIGLAPSTIQVTSPNGFESYAVGSQYYIQWNSTSVSAVNLEYSTNGGTSYTSIATNVNASTGYYYWTVPNTPSANCLVRVSDANNAALSDASNNTFTIVTPYITVTTPNGGETLNTGNGYYIQWNSSGVSYVTIDLSVDGGTTYSTVVSTTYNNGYYWWSPTTSNVSTQCKIRVKDAATGATLSDESNANFTIQTPTPSITVTSPITATTWVVGSSYYITWNSVSVSNVKIEFSANGGTTWTTVVASYSASSGYYSWNIPNSVTSNGLIRVSDASASTVNGLSGQFNIIPNTPTLAVTYPNGAENLQVGSYTYISWTANNVSCTNLEVSYNNGTSWSTLASNLSTNYFYWNVPNNASTNCKVRVTDCYSSLTDASDAVFTISVPVANNNTITVNAINDNVYCKGDTITVDYTATGVYNSGNSFSIQLSDASGSFASPVYLGGESGTALTGSISVLLPANATNGTAYKVRVVASNLVATSAGSSAFTIQGPTADFTANPYQNVYLLPQDASVQFVPSTTGSVASYAWTFGDGGTASAEAPTHYYGTTIFFDVNLTVTDSNGCKATALKPDYIHTEYYLENTDVIPQGFVGTVTGASFVNSNVGCFTLSNGNCFVTNNSGASWTTSVTGVPAGTQLTSASLIPGYWVIAGNNGTLCYSTNQGTTWVPYYTGTTATFNSVSMASATSGYAVGTGGAVYIFDGTSWTSSSISGANNVTFNGVASYGTNGALAVGTGGSIYSYNGTAWSAVTSALYNSSYNFTSIHTDADTAFVTATNGSICKLTHSGATWTPTVALTGTGTAFKGISGKGSDITAVGDSGIVYQSNNGGNTFARFSIGGSANLTTVALRKPRGFIGGVANTGRAFGVVEDSTTSIINNTLVNQTKLYPNPASNTVTISIDGNNNETLQIAIKDVTGRNVYDVANEQISGTYKKQINVGAFAKGTYFAFVTRNGKQIVMKFSVE